MKNYGHIGTFLGAVFLLACSLAGAQGPPENSSAAQAAQKPPAKSHKTWTDDDVKSLRTPGDNYVLEKESQAAAARTQAEAEQATKQSAAEPANQRGKHGLANPKSLDEADRMIAWEQRDLDAQQEAVDRTRKELAEAAPEEKAHKQKVLEQYLENVENVRREKQALLKQKGELEKKAKASPNSASL
jgi:hypothetical protein